MSLPKTRVDNPTKNRGISTTNKISSRTVRISRFAGLALSIAPRQLQSVRQARNQLLGFQRFARDINAITNNNVKQRIGNRVKGRVGGLMVNAALPKTNNIVLRLARARIGSSMNKVIHRKGGLQGAIFKLFGPKATNSVIKNLFTVEATGNIFQMMHRTMAMAARGFAPRDQFVMNIGGTILEFSPGNLADSVHMRQPKIRPRKGVIAEYEVVIGGQNETSNIADKAPYVHVANYGGILFNPKTGTNDKVYKPTFFAQRAVETTANLYRPIIKRAGEIFDPYGINMSGQKMVSVVYNARSKTAFKIWLNRDGKFAKKQKEIDQDKRRRRNVDMGYEVEVGKLAAYNQLPEKAYEEAIAAGAEETMEYLYGGKISKIRETTRVKGSTVKANTMKASTVKGHQRKLKVKDRESSGEPLRGAKTKVTSHKRSAAKRKESTRKSHKRTYRREYDVGVSAGTGQVTIIADMRELKAKDRSKARYLVGQNNRYAERMLQPANLRIRRDLEFDLGTIALDKQTRTLLKEARNKGIIDFKFRGNKVQSAVIKDLDAFEKFCAIDTLDSARASMTGGKVNPNARAAELFGANSRKIKNNIEQSLTKSEIRELAHKARTNVPSASVSGVTARFATGTIKDEKGRNISQSGTISLSIDKKLKDKEQLLVKAEQHKASLERQRNAINMRTAGVASGKEAEYYRLTTQFSVIKFGDKRVYGTMENGIPKPVYSEIFGGEDGFVEEKVLRRFRDTRDSTVSGRKVKLDNAIKSQNKAIRDLKKEIKGLKASASEATIDLQENFATEFEKLKSLLIEEKFAAMQGSTYFQQERVSGISRKIKSVSRQNEDLNLTSKGTTSFKKTMPLLGGKGTTRLTFKIDNSQAALADTRGIGGFVVEVNKSKVGPAGTAPGQRAGRKRTIKPIGTPKINNGFMELTFKDPELPTGRLVLRANIETGKLNSRGIQLKTASGGKVKNVTKTTGKQTLFVETQGGGLRRVKPGENLEGVSVKKYGVTGGSSARFRDNEIKILNTTPSGLESRILESRENDFLLDQAVLGAALLEEVKNERRRKQEETVDARGYKTRRQKDRSYIIRFEDF